MKPLPSLLALAVVAALPASAASLWTSGHGDIGIGYEGGQLELHFHLGEDGGEPAIVDSASISDQEFEPNEIIVVGNDNIETTSNAALAAGTGVADGQPLWVLPQTEGAASAAEVPFMGWGTEELSPGDWTGNLIVTLDSVTSPSGSGDFSLFQDDGLGGFNFAMSTSDGIDGSDALSLAAGAHEHYALGFSEPGLWQITLTATGTHDVDGVRMDTATYTFQIPEPSRAVLLGLGMIGLVMRRKR
jgi:surface-anchored protein